MNYDQNDCQQFYFITPLFSDTSKHTKNKSWRRCRLYFRGRMRCWWIFHLETNYSLVNKNVIFWFLFYLEFILFTLLRIYFLFYVYGKFVIFVDSILTFSSHP
jgi:hypothetical protein